MKIGSIVRFVSKKDGIDTLTMIVGEPTSGGLLNRLGYFWYISNVYNHIKGSTIPVRNDEIQLICE